MEKEFVFVVYYYETDFMHHENHIEIVAVCASQEGAKRMVEELKEKPLGPFWDGVNYEKFALES